MAENVMSAIDADGYATSQANKDIIITAGGKNITPAELENDLKFSPSFPMLSSSAMAESI